MSLERITEFQSRMDKIRDPRVRRGFIDNFHASLVRGDIYGLTPDEIDVAAALEAKYGFKPHSRKLLNHSAYKENAKSMEALEKIKFGWDLSYWRPALDRGVERGLFSADVRDEAIEEYEDKKCIAALADVRRGYNFEGWRPALDRGVQRGLFSAEDRDEALVECADIQVNRIVKEARNTPRQSNVIAGLPSYCVR